MVFIVGLRSIFTEFTLENSMEPLWSLKRQSRPTPKANNPLTKKIVENLKRNMRRRDKRPAKASTPKLPLPPTVKLVLRRATQ